MRRSAFEPIQHPLQLCVLQPKLPRQLIPQQPDFSIEADCIVGNDNPWRWLRSDIDDFGFLGLSAAFSRRTFVNPRGLGRGLRGYGGVIG